MPHPVLRLTGLWLVALLAACSGGTSSAGKPDARDDVRDAAGEVRDAWDASRDAGHDARDVGDDVPDAGHDAPDTVEVAPDAGHDVPDAPPDVPDVSNDVPDAPPDVPDVSSDVPDAPPDVPDASDDVPDASDAGLDTPADECPDDPDKVAPGLCGCGVVDTPGCAEIEPPVPDPPGWAEAPHATGPASIAMRAESVADPSGVEYAFLCAAGPCHDSGWQPGPAYEDTDLAPDQACAYRVKARDLSPNHNETGWSAEALAVTDRDPGFAAGLEARFFDFDSKLEGMPALSGLTADVERVDAQLAYAPTSEPWSGLDAGFADTFACRHGGFLRVEHPGEHTLTLVADDGARLWLGAEPMLDSAGGLEASGSRFLAAGYHPLRVDSYEDGGLAGLTLAWAGPGFAQQVVPGTALYHADPADLAPPTPNPAQWASPPVATGTGSVAMAAAVATDGSGVQYFFECALGGGHDSGWQVGTTYDDSGLQPGTRYVYRVRTRDLSLAENVTTPSAPVSVTTRTTAPDVVGLALEVALAALVDATLEIGEVAYEHNDAASAGVVLDQGPPAGTELAAGATVALVVSLGPEPVVISELMYHPAAAVAPEEFVELYNASAHPVPLEGWTLGGLGTFAFGSDVVLEPGGYLVAAEDAIAFEAAYGFAPDVEVGGASLSNGGERVSLVTPAGVVADEVTYDDVAPWPVTPDGLGPSLEVIDPNEDNATPRNWHASRAEVGPTPGAVNSVDAEGLPPWITEVGHGIPEADVPLTVTAVVVDATAVTLTYVLDWGSPQTLPMADDGQVGDGAAGDGVYGALLPAQPVGTLIRYRLDASGPTGTMGFPRDDDTVLYTGAYLAPAVATDLDVFHWLIDPAAYEAALAHYATNQPEPAYLYHAGVLYDGVQVRVRGQSSRQWPKKHWNFSFAEGHRFDAPGFTAAPVNGFNLQSSYADKSYVREILSYETFGDGGCPSHRIVPVVVYQNGQFFGLYNFLEDMDSVYLERNGLDPEGGFYKAFDSQCQQQPLEVLPGPWEKVGPDDGDFTELYDFLTGVNHLAGQARRDFLFDTIDIPACLTYQAVSVLIHNNDQVAKNYYLYRDSKGTGRWSMQAWDMDLTFGRS